MKHAALILSAVLLGACRQDMHDQPKYEPYEASDFFADGRSVRPQVTGTVARGELRLDPHLYEGRVDGELAETFPFEVTAEVMERGRERYAIFCAPCHGPSGYGDGMIVQRGLRAPASFHIDRLRESPPGYFFDVMTNGFGIMYDYSNRVEPRDRWAITAFIRALQLSQNAELADAAPEARRVLEEEGS